MDFLESMTSLVLGAVLVVDVSVVDASWQICSSLVASTVVAVGFVDVVGIDFVVVVDVDVVVLVDFVVVVVVVCYGSCSLW